ncbi:MAG: PEP-CTERM sorting domain-containing protein, partial [Gammaproteobacteria bacterium]|nr:PEP-CTERM sorting domain-containing protein [Gammaproteobacteria bacterium]
FYAWAVRPGDIAPVPVPGAVWLFGGALTLLGAVRRRAMTVIR